MIKDIHQSSLGMALRCGEQFRRRYIEGHIIPPGIGAGRGTGLHRANEVNLSQKILTKKDLPVSDLLDAARDGYVNSFRNGVYLPKKDISAKNRLLNDGLNETLSLTGLYREKVAPEIIPKEVERSFLVNVEGVQLPLAGRIDMEEDGIVNDLKTSKMKWAEGRIKTEIQPIFYSFVHEQETGVRPKFVYHILRCLKGGPERQVQTLIPSMTDYRGFMAKLKIFCEMLQAGIFMPANPSSWWCTEAWCGYWATCKFNGNL